MPELPELTKAALARLEKVLDDENAALSAFDSRNSAEFIRVKTQCLLELQRAPSSEMPPPPELSSRLQALRHKLELNRWLLSLHLDAAKEISAVIMSAIRDAESDGTYSRSLGALRALT
jgi:hypothetical protein